MANVTATTTGCGRSSRASPRWLSLIAARAQNRRLSTAKYESDDQASEVPRSRRAYDRGDCDDPGDDRASLRLSEGRADSRPGIAVATAPDARRRVVLAASLWGHPRHSRSCSSSQRTSGAAISFSENSNAAAAIVPNVDRVPAAVASTMQPAANQASAARGEDCRAKIVRRHQLPRLPVPLTRHLGR